MEVQASLTVLSVLYEMNRTGSKLYSAEQIFSEKILAEIHHNLMCAANAAMCRVWSVDVERCHVEAKYFPSSGAGC